jgi:GNAT superfamily N-acetyltransferase
MLKIRAAVREDIPLILQFIRELAEYEHEPESARATEADLLRDGWGPQPKFHCVIAEWADDNQPNGAAALQPAGFALYFNNYSTWRGRPGLFLEDLFVRPSFRRKGIGRGLLLHLAQIAVRENYGRYEWQVLDWNRPARDFYESLGAKLMSQWLLMRVEGEALERMAALSTENQVSSTK